MLSRITNIMVIQIYMHVYGYSAIFKFEYFEISPSGTYFKFYVFKMYIKNLKKHAVGKLKHQIDLPVEPLTIWLSGVGEAEGEAEVAAGWAPSGVTAGCPTSDTAAVFRVSAKKDENLNRCLIINAS